MIVSSERPLFSVIIPTRNRSSAFAVALQSVLEQSFGGFEVIVVDDGSSDEHEPQYRATIETALGKVRMLSLARTKRGRGPSYGRNYGAAQARAKYLCFLDDDDQWTDSEHLRRAAGVIAAAPRPIELILANQQAYRDGTPVSGVVWIEDLQERLRGKPDAAGAYSVTAAELLACPAHCHLNTTIVSRRFYMDLGGFDEGLRYEEDRDFYLRAIDRARVIKFLPWTVSRHNIPDPAVRASTSTAELELSKRLYQLRVLDKAVLFSARPELRRYAMRQRGYILNYIAAEAARLGGLDCAAYYAAEALITKLIAGCLSAAAALGLGSQSSATASCIGEPSRDRGGCKTSRRMVR